MRFTKIPSYSRSVGARRRWGWVGGRMREFWVGGCPPAQNTHRSRAPRPRWHQPPSGSLEPLLALPAGHTCAELVSAALNVWATVANHQAWAWQRGKGYFCFLFRLAHEKAFSSFLLKYTQRAQYTESVNCKERTRRILKAFNLTTDAVVNS